MPRQYVLHVGDLHARRNLAMVVRAVASVRRKQPALASLGLVLAGVDRGTGASLQQSSDAGAGTSPLLTFAGPTSEALLLALYRSAAALVYPSRYEGFGLPLLEAMACGTPVIAARTSSIPEVVGDAGVLLDPDDERAWVSEIERVLDDSNHRDRLREAGLARAREFSWERTARQTAAVYRSLLGARP
jgi:glycosyltransferase involved in cell wall biosynthesis